MAKETTFTRVGLTGGIASGKSCVAALLRQKGVRVIDLDALGRTLTDSDSELLEWARGHGVVSEEKIDRRKLRELAFARPEVLKDLEKRLHPKIRAAFEKEARAAQAAGERLVVCEAALLVESGIHRELDRLVVVTAPLAVRKKRLIDRDKVTEALADRIIAAQTGDEEKEKHADDVLRNTGSLVELVASVERMLGEWRAEGIWLPKR